MTLILDEIRLRMAIVFMNSIWQERKGLLMSHDILMEVAQFRARDMALQGYFDHKDPLGFWPNYRVEDFGYDLPDGWAEDTNYVESIGMGFSQPEGFIEALYVSDDHRPHVTGNVPFFYAHRYFGVGYSVGASSDGTPVPYYVLITAPPQKIVETTDEFTIYLPGIYA